MSDISAIFPKIGLSQKVDESYIFWRMWFSLGSCPFLEGFSMKNILLAARIWSITKWYFSFCLIPIPASEFLRAEIVPFRFYSLVPGSALVMRKEVAFKISSLIYSQVLKVLVKFKIVFLNFSAVPVKSILLIAKTNFNWGVLLKVR